MKWATELAILTVLMMFQAQAGAAPKVCWEAETTATIHKPLRRIPHSSDKKVSGGGYLKMPWVKNHLDGSVTYRFKVKVPGKYYVWLRTMWSNDFSNRINVSLMVA